MRARFKNLSFFFFFLLLFSGLEAEAEKVKTPERGTETAVQWKCGYLAVQKSEKKSGRGVEREKHRQSVRRNEMLFRRARKHKVPCGHKRKGGFSKGRSRLRLVSLSLFSFFFSATVFAHYVSVITTMSRAKKLSSLQIRGLLSRSRGFPEGNSFALAPGRLIYNP